MVPLRAPVDPRDTALCIAMPSRSVEVDPFTRLPGQLARGQVEAIRSAVPDALAETVREGGGRFGIRNIRVRLARAKGRIHPLATRWRPSVHLAARAMLT